MKRTASASASTSSNSVKKAKATSKSVPSPTTGMDFSKFKLVRVVPEREVDDEEEEEDFDENEDLELDYECPWLRKAKSSGSCDSGSLISTKSRIPSTQRWISRAHGHLKSKFRHEGNKAWGAETDGSFLVYLHEIEIVESQRGKGIGTWALQEIWKVYEQDTVEGLGEMEFLFAQPATLGTHEDRDLRLNPGTRHRRTQTASISQHTNVEIIVTASSPGEGSFPLSQLPTPSRSNLSPPVSIYDTAREDDVTAKRTTKRAESWKTISVILLALLSVAELLHYGQKSYNELLRKERIPDLQEEERRNLVRREIASNLFPNTTFYPPTSSSSSSSISSPTSNVHRSFVFPVRIAEQESKAQQHLHQLALLAISLNRTLVLPNVGGSRLHSCHLFPFAFHYDIDSWIKRYEGKLSVVQQEEWLKRVEGESTVYSVRSVRLKEGKKVVGSQLEQVGRQKEEDHPFVLSDFCLDKASSFFEPAQPSVSTFYAPFRYREFDNVALGGFANGLVSSLSRLFLSPSTDSLTPVAFQTIPSFNSSIPIDVLFVDYNLRYHIFPTMLPNSTDLTPPPPSPLPPPIDVDDAIIDLDPVDLAEEMLSLSDYSVAHYDPFPFLRLLAPSSPLESRQHPFLSFSPMPYSTLWTELSRRIAENLSPFAGVHWRMENVPSSHLSSCATSLARTLDSLSTEPKPPLTVYLASDYSFDSVLSTSNHSAVAHSLSDTFNHLTSSHRAAASRLVHLLRPSTSFLSWILPSTFHATRSPPSLKTLPTVLESTPSLLPLHLTRALESLDGDLFALDSGLKGVLDKLVLAEADYFVAGSPEKGKEMCGKGSSFTESVLDQRRSRKESSTTAQNVSEGDEIPEEAEGETEKVIGIGEPEIEMDSDIVRWFRRPA
ncbi:hypothetical protein JCM5350_005478 [Sporobolomyces pararoseus]